MIEFTNDEIDTIKELLCDWGLDCPGTDSDKVQELKYKLGLEKRPTPEELAEKERRYKEFADSPIGKQMTALMNQSNKIALNLINDKNFFSGSQLDFPLADAKIGSSFRIRLPTEYNINILRKPSLFRRFLNFFKRNKNNV